MPGILCIGYDVESDNPVTTKLFLEAMVPIHEELGVPCTLFIKGKTFLRNVDRIKALAGNKLFDLQQHTFSHLIFKRIDQVIDGMHHPVGHDEPAKKIRKEIVKTNKIFQKHLKCRPTGLTTPYAFYKGLADRPDILAVLHDAGIRFVRSYGRNEQGFNPVPLDVQPFFYDEQGFPDILECPVQGWQDCIWRDRFGWNAAWEDEVGKALDHVAAHGSYLGLVQHDWSSIQEDVKMERTRAIIGHAITRGMEILHYKQLYEKMVKIKL